MGNTPLKLSEDLIEKHNKYTTSTKTTFNTELKDSQTFQSDYCIITLFLLNDSRLYVQGISNLVDYIELDDHRATLSLYDRVFVTDNIVEIAKTTKGFTAKNEQGKEMESILCDEE